VEFGVQTRIDLWQARHDPASSARRAASRWRRASKASPRRDGEALDKRCKLSTEELSRAARPRQGGDARRREANLIEVPDDNPAIGRGLARGDPGEGRLSNRSRPPLPVSRFARPTGSSGGFPRRSAWERAAGRPLYRRPSTSSPTCRRAARRSP
jgi:hypothetical protein